MTSRHQHSIYSMILDKKQPSKRKLIRDTKKIKVSFGGYQTNLVEPRSGNNYRVPLNKNKNLNKAQSSNLVELENEFLEQTHKLRLLEHVESSGMLAGEFLQEQQEADTADAD